MGEPAEHVAIASRFQVDVDAERYTRFALQSVHYDLACNSLKRFNTPLRTLDALHLAIAHVEHRPWRSMMGDYIWAPI